MEPVPGLHYVPNYLNQTDQARLIAVIEQQPWLSDLKRRVQHYGYRYDYTRRTVDSSAYLGVLPDWAAPLAERLHHDHWIAQPPDQLIVNEYQPGQGIAAHVDCVPCFGDTILSISLGSPCVMLFACADQRVPVLLEAGSLVVMQGAARYGWKHSIPARKSDVYEGRKIERGRRISLTFRKVITA
ncbi:MAG: alpha-ketoglutarate-dependent dioxygenase AlkB [Anaerolineae bacterium]|nr:alpha-ketoglutarate-dependent dioxygenase AlkB [Anaerolineae bacterium]